MSVRILSDATGSMAAIYCSTTDLAFGPVFYGDGGHYADERAEAFLEWLPQDARKYDDAELQKKYQEWRSQEVQAWKQKEACS